MVPMNLMKNKVADYIVTGQWAKKAYPRKAVRKANAIASSADKTFSYIPTAPICRSRRMRTMCISVRIIPFTAPSTRTLPNTKGKLLVADQSSCFLSEPVDVTKVRPDLRRGPEERGTGRNRDHIVREDLVTEDVLPGTPPCCATRPMWTRAPCTTPRPPTASTSAAKVFKWLKARGGLEAMKQYNEEKAKILYDFLDQSKLFKGTVVKQDRSLMNVPFVTGDEENGRPVCEGVQGCGPGEFKGPPDRGRHARQHLQRDAHGRREKLVEFMDDFEKKVWQINVKLEHCGRFRVERGERL